mmetsp:Transcript_28440/g.86975  ORF Transcript_28440/g.86975 Transcript_28440/m.86975 type:complete len:228 (-) Transcript_28440:1268-1951(-)
MKGGPHLSTSCSLHSPRSDTASRKTTSGPSAARCWIPSLCSTRRASASCASSSPTARASASLMRGTGASGRRWCTSARIHCRHHRPPSRRCSSKCAMRSMPCCVKSRPLSSRSSRGRLKSSGGWTQTPTTGRPSLSGSSECTRGMSSRRSTLRCGNGRAPCLPLGGRAIERVTGRALPALTSSGRRAHRMGRTTPSCRRSSMTWTALSRRPRRPSPTGASVPACCPS